MNITNFSVSTDRTQLNLVLENASDATTLKLWKNFDYKDYSKAIDLSSKLTGLSTENISISLNDLGISYFDGVYFIEVEGDDDTLNSLVSDLTRYKECVLNKLREVSVCLDCPSTKLNVALTNTHSILVGLEIAVEQGFINDILLKMESLNKYCSNACKTCGDKNNIIDTNYYSTND